MKGESAKGKKKGTNSDQPSNDEHQKIYEKEEILMQTLGPLENFLMSLQSVLVWETPSHSIALFVVVHLLFWLATTLRVYYVVGVIGVLLVLTDMWKNHIWPEIRVPPSPGEDMEGWTPVHPRLLSVPEICQYAAPCWQKTENFVTYSINLRKNNHPKFFFLSMLILCSVGVVGLYIRGITLAYFIVLFMLLWPCFLYNNGWNKAQEVLEPIISSVESTMRVRRSRSKAGKKKRGAEVAMVTLSTDSDSDDLEQFVPEPEADQKTSVLSEATEEESEEEDGEEQVIMGLLTPPSIPSQTPSQDASDIEEGSSSGDLSSLALGLPSMPAYDDTLDGTLHHDNKPEELGREASIDLEQALEKTTRSSHDDSGSSSPTGEMAGQLEEAINFVTSHFSQFDKSESETEQVEPSDVIDEEQLTGNLNFPDMSEDTTDTTGTDSADADVDTDAAGSLAGAQQALSHMLSQPREALVQRGQALVSKLSGPAAMSDTVTSLVAHTVAGLSSLKDSVTGANKSQASEPEPHMLSSADSKQLEAEFEFLDEEELENIADDDETEKV